jgi:hypothetical protein
LTHPGTGADWLVWLEATGLAVAMRQWLWLYPIVEIIHIAGIVLLVGGAVLFDLRLLGLAPQLPVTDLARHLLRWARAGFTMVVPTGLLMFTAHATEMAVNPAFRLKLLLIALGGLNAGAFHWGPFRGVVAWNQDATPPTAARIAAALSLAVWTGVIACGRLLAYF